MPFHIFPLQRGYDTKNAVNMLEYMKNEVTRAIESVNNLLDRVNLTQPHGIETAQWLLEQAKVLQSLLENLDTIQFQPHPDITQKGGEAAPLPPA